MKTLSFIRLLFCLVAFYSIVCTASAQTVPPMQWEKSLGGSNDDEAYAIEQTTDGGFIVAGLSFSDNDEVTGHRSDSLSSDYWIVKLDANGRIEWQKSLGGSNYDHAFSIEQTTDGGYIVAGGSYSNDIDVSVNHGKYDYWIVRLDGTGEIIWQKSLGGSDDDEAESIRQTTDGGFIVAGYSFSTNDDVTGHHGDSTTSDCWIVKLDGEGTIQWSESLGGNDYDEAYSIRQTTDDGYIIAGYSFSINGDVTGHHGDTTTSDFWIVKLSGSGVIQWEKSLGGSGYDEAFSICQTADGGYVAAGYSTSNDYDVSGNHGGIDYWVVKMDAGGAIQWAYAFGGSADDRAQSIRQTSDGGYIVAGFTESADGDVTFNYGFADFWLVKLDSNGALQWQVSLGGSNYDFAQSILQIPDGGYVVAGYSHSKDGCVSRNHGGYDFWIAKLDNLSSVQEKPMSIPADLSFFPNPFSSSTQIDYDVAQPGAVQMDVLNALGETIATPVSAEHSAGHYTAEFSGEQLPSGIYFVRLSANGTVQTRMMQVIR